MCGRGLASLQYGSHDEGFVRRELGAADRGGVVQGPGGKAESRRIRSPGQWFINLRPDTPDGWCSYTRLPCGESSGFAPFNVISFLPLSRQGTEQKANECERHLRGDRSRRIHFEQMNHAAIGGF